MPMWFAYTPVIFLQPEWLLIVFIFIKYSKFCTATMDHRTKLHAY